MFSDDQQIIDEFITEASEHLANIENQLLSIEESSNVELVHQVFRNVHSMKGAAGFLGFAAISELAHHLEGVLNLIRNQEIIPSGAVIEALLAGFDTLRKMVGQVERQQEFDILTPILQLQQIANSAIQPEPSSATAEGDPAAPAQPAVSALNVEAMLPAAIAELLAPVAAPALASPVASSPIDSPTPSEPAPKATPDATSSSKRSTAEASIRVPVAILDRLMNLAGELVLGRNQLLQHVTNQCQTGLEAVGTRIDQVTTNLQEAIMNARMQQVGAVFNRFPRLVRDVCQKLDKQCRLDLEGSEVELDKTILEAICDPLTHLIRNSLDHGIESPSARVLAGKPRSGTLTLRAYHQAGKVHITVQDDGGGINPARLKEKGIQKGLITPAQAATMSDREAIRLIFRPGFSTAEVITEVSGRGVGMDVVKTNIEKLGGTVEIESTLGKGTTIHVQLPLTLAIIPSLIVASGKERYAIPESAIIELVRFSPSDSSMKLERFKNSEVLRYRDDLLPLIRLRPLLRQQNATLGSDAPPRRKRSSRLHHSHADAKTLNIIVLEAGMFRYGLVVDAVLDPEQIVVKPLGSHIKNCRCLAGATVLGDGEVAFILDVPGIASQAELAAMELSRTRQGSAENSTPEQEIHTILIFRSRSEDLYAAPMAMVSRIERITKDQIQRLDNRLLLQYRGGALPLMDLSSESTDPRPHLPENVYVLVFDMRGREVGLIVPHIVDICDATADVDTRGCQGNGVMGVMVIDGQFVQLLDMHEFTQSILESTPAGQRSTSQDPPNAHRLGTILLAEDSPFFREQVRKFLESENYSVVVCEDGQIAWETLQESIVQVDLIVTDVEMPNMNGFELCRNVKADPQWQNIPVIALTSMSDARHIRMGVEAGVDEYQIKMDRARLIETVRRKMPRAKKPVLVK